MGTTVKLCDECEEPISAKRLAVMPSAVLCVPCLSDTGDVPKYIGRPSGGALAGGEEEDKFSSIEVVRAKSKEDIEKIRSEFISDYKIPIKKPIIDKPFEELKDSYSEEG